MIDQLSGIVSSMKRLIPVLLTAVAAVAAVAAVRLMEGDPLPRPPEGTWELDEDASTS